jgi:hypothetical protein
MLLSLPNEIMTHIVDHCDLFTQVNLALSCQKMGQLVRGYAGYYASNNEKWKKIEKMKGITEKGKQTVIDFRDQCDTYGKECSSFTITPINSIMRISKAVEAEEQIRIPRVYFHLLSKCFSDFCEALDSTFPTKLPFWIKRKYNVAMIEYDGSVEISGVEFQKDVYIGIHEIFGLPALETLRIQDMRDLERESPRQIAIEMAQIREDTERAVIAEYGHIPREFRWSNRRETFVVDYYGTDYEENWDELDSETEVILGHLRFRIEEDIDEYIREQMFPEGADDLDTSDSENE